MLKRLNMYQYGTRAAFVRDLQQLEQLAAADDAVRLLQVPDDPHTDVLGAHSGTEQLTVSS